MNASWLRKKKEKRKKTELGQILEFRDQRIKFEIWRAWSAILEDLGWTKNWI